MPLLRVFRLVDWDQTIPLGYELLQTQDAPPTWISKIKHYFVDEYQDFNRAEQALIALLAKAAESIVIVGDDDQSLYASRGGSPEGMRTMYADDRTNDTVSLVKCYRCKSVIVRVANAFQTTMHSEPRLMTSAKTGGEVLCYRFKSGKAEWAFLIQYLRERIAELPESPAPKDGIVCLFPSWRVLDSYFEHLKPHLPCLRRRDAIDPKRLWLQRVLRLVATPGQRFLERLLLNDYKEVKPRHRLKMVARILRDDIGPSVACDDLIRDGSFTGKAAEAARDFVNLCKVLSSRDARAISALVAPVLGITADLIEEQVSNFVGASDNPDQDDSISDVCDAVLPTTTEPGDDPKAILFLTMRGSKGLTKRTVVIPGLEHCWLPGDATAEGLKEKQRMFYVALSRATDRVLITFPSTRGSNDTLNFEIPGRGEPSCFVRNAGLRSVYHE